MLLNLGGNRIEGEGTKALAAAIAGGAIANLEKLYLDGNRIGDEGAKALAAAIAGEALPKLTCLDLQFSKASEAAQQEVQDAINNRNDPPAAGLPC